MVISMIQLINLSLKVPDMIILKNVYYALALYFEHTRDFQNAIHAYTKLRGAAEGDDDFEGCCISFMQRGGIYISMQEYQYALRCYKFVLTYSWLLKNVEYEILAYKGIAICYYYQALMKKSNFYYRRFSKGKVEPDTSNMKIYAMKRYTNYFKISGLKKEEKVTYDNGMVIKTRDYTSDYSFAAKFINDPKIVSEMNKEIPSSPINSSLSRLKLDMKEFEMRELTKQNDVIRRLFSRTEKRNLRIKIETNIEYVLDKDLPSPSISSSTKGNLFVQMKKAKKIVEASIPKEEKEKISSCTSEDESEQEESPQENRKYTILPKILSDSENEERKLKSRNQRKLIHKGATTRNPNTIDYLKIYQNEKKDHQ